ncbi:MAG: succinyl-diaminopimelate desuccinylase [Acidimicrobiales bacterium]
MTPGGDLLDRVAELVATPSVSLNETALADVIERCLRSTPWLDVVRIGDNVVGRSPGVGSRIVVAGHLDTVPPNGNETPRREGDVLWGLGAADMKAGLSVMLELAGEEQPPPIGLTLVFYVAEEISREHNGLLQIQVADPEVLAADAAILCEPTGAVVEAGCQGSLALAVTLVGARAHTARPWRGSNAVHRLGPLMERVSSWPGRLPVLDGCAYREALQAVAVHGGVAGNVVPDAVTVTFNHRFAPDRTAQQAAEALRSYFEPVLDEGTGDRVVVVDAAGGALPNLGQPLLARLVEATEAPPRAKLGWTDVAFFAEQGIPAANFGPGDPELAHTAAERVTLQDVQKVHRTLRALIYSR